MKKLRAALDIAATISVTIASLAVLWYTLSPRLLSQPAAADGNAKAVENVESRHLAIDAPDAKQYPQARLALVEFSDFECPFCARYARETLSPLKREFVDTGQVAYIFRHLPLQGVHAQAFVAAQAAECAAQQARFWPMHDFLFRNQHTLAAVDWRGEAPALGLDEKKFQMCLSDDLVVAKIKKDEDEGQRLGIRSTPTFLLGTVDVKGTIVVRRRINGARPYSVFRAAVQELLALPITN